MTCLLVLVLGASLAAEPATVLFTGSGSGSDGALQAMREPGPSWRVLVFSGADTTLAREFSSFAGQPVPESQPVLVDQPGPLLMVKGERFFREVQVGRDPLPASSLELWSDRYAPIVLRSWTEEDAPLHFVLPDGASDARFVGLPGKRDLRPAFEAFLRGHGFSSLALEPVPGPRLRRAPGPGLRFAGDLSSMDAGWKQVELDLGVLLADPNEPPRPGSWTQQCEVGAFRAVDALAVERVGVTSSHVYLEVRLTLQHCDWEAGGCGCQVETGPGAVPRLLVLERQAMGHPPVRAGVFSLSSPVSLLEGKR